MDYFCRGTKASGQKPCETSQLLGPVYIMGCAAKGSSKVNILSLPICGPNPSTLKPYPPSVEFFTGWEALL